MMLDLYGITKVPWLLFVIRNAQTWRVRTSAIAKSRRLEVTLSFPRDAMTSVSLVVPDLQTAELLLCQKLG